MQADVLDIGRDGEDVAFAVGFTRLVGGGGTDRPAVLQMGVEAAHDAVGVKGVAVGGAAHGEVVRLETGAQRLDPPAAHFLGHRGGMMLDHVGRVALEVNRHGLDAGDGAQTRHGVDHAADLLERGARGEDLVDQLGVGTRGAFAGEDLRDEVLRGDVEAGAFDGLAAGNDHPFAFGVLLNREIVADLVLPGVGGGELAVREGELFFSDAGLVKVLEKLVGTPGEVGAFEVDRAGGIDLALGSFGREERVAVEVGGVELERRVAGERELGTKLLGFGGGVGGLLRGSAEGHLGVFTEHDGRADFKDEVRSGLGGRRVGLDLVGHGRGDVETKVAGFSRQRAVDLVGLVDDDVGALDVERAVAEREGADFNAGLAFDVQRLGALWPE